MTSDEFTVWWQEYQRNPWGERHDAAYFAMVAQTVTNMAGKMTKSEAPLSAFILNFDPADEPVAEIDPATYFAKK